MSSKRFNKLKEIKKETNSETIEKLLPIVKKNCTTKFDESIDLSFQKIVVLMSLGVMNLLKRLKMDI